MALSEHDRRILDALEASLGEGGSARRRSAMPHEHRRIGRLGAYLTGGASVLVAIALTTLAVSLPAPVNICVSVAAYLVTVALTARVAVLHRHRPRRVADAKR